MDKKGLKNKHIKLINNDIANQLLDFSISKTLILTHGISMMCYTGMLVLVWEAALSGGLVASQVMAVMVVMMVVVMVPAAPPVIKQDGVFTKSDKHLATMLHFVCQSMKTLYMQ